MNQKHRKPRAITPRNRILAGFWISVLSLTVLLPLAGLSDRRDEAPADRGPAVVSEDLRDVDQMLRESLVAIKRGHYEAAVWAADEVLRVEPSNVTALELQGSAFFFLEERQQARSVWRRALELEPDNKAVLALLKRI